MPRMGTQYSRRENGAFNAASRDYGKGYRRGTLPKAGDILNRKNTLVHAFKSSKNHNFFAKNEIFFILLKVLCFLKKVYFIFAEKMEYLYGLEPVY